MQLFQGPDPQGNNNAAVDGLYPKTGSYQDKSGSQQYNAQDQNQST